MTPVMTPTFDFHLVTSSLTSRLRFRPTLCRYWQPALNSHTSLLDDNFSIVYAKPWKGAVIRMVLLDKFSLDGSSSATTRCRSPKSSCSDETLTCRPGWKHSLRSEGFMHSAKSINELLVRNLFIWYCIHYISIAVIIGLHESCSPRTTISKLRT